MKQMKLLSIAIPSATLITSMVVAPSLTVTGYKVKDNYYQQSKNKEKSSLNYDDIITRFYKNVAQNSEQLFNQFLTKDKQYQKNIDLLEKSARRTHGSRPFGWDENYGYHMLQAEPWLNPAHKVGDKYYYPAHSGGKDDKPIIFQNIDLVPDIVAWNNNNSVMVTGGGVFSLDKVDDGGGYAAPTPRQTDDMRDWGNNHLIPDWDYASILDKFLNFEKNYQNPYFQNFKFTFAKVNNNASWQDWWKDVKDGGYWFHKTQELSDCYDGKWDWLDHIWNGKGDLKSPYKDKTGQTSEEHGVHSKAVFSKEYFGGVGGKGVTMIHFELKNDFEVPIYGYGLDNVFTITDFGQDENGWYTTVGLNPYFFLAAEAEVKNLQTKNWWDSCLVEGNRVNWVPPQAVQSKPNWEKARDALFAEIEGLMNISSRKITFDNYDTVRKLVLDYCNTNKEVPDAGWVTDKLNTVTELQNYGWPQLSTQYKITGDSNIWDTLTLMLPLLKFDIKLDENSNPEQPVSGTWSDFQTKNTIEFKDLKDGVKVYTSNKTASSVAIKIKADSVQNTHLNDATILPCDSQKTIRKNNDKLEVWEKDWNMSDSQYQVKFLTGDTIQCILDPKSEHQSKGAGETYWYFNQNAKIISDVNNLKKLKLNDESYQYVLPTDAWANAVGTGVNDKLKSMIVDENSNPASLYCYKDFAGNIDYSVPDRNLQAICHNNEGTIEIRLIDPDDANAIYWTTKIGGFLKNESSTEINFNFLTPFLIGSGKDSEVVSCSLTNPIENSVFKYKSENINVATVKSVGSETNQFVVTGVAEGETKIVVELWDSDEKVKYTASSFTCEVYQSPSSIQITKQPTGTIKAPTGGTGYWPTGFNAIALPTSTPQVIGWSLYSDDEVPAWLNISYNGYIYWENAVEGTYEFYAIATSLLDENKFATSEKITLIVKPEAEKSIQLSEGYSKESIDNLNQKSHSYTFVQKGFDDMSKTTVKLANVKMNGAECSDLAMSFSVDNTLINLTIDYSKLAKNSNDVLTFDLTFTNEDFETTLQGFKITFTLNSGDFNLADGQSKDLKYKLGTNSFNIDFVQSGFEKPNETLCTCGNFKLNDKETADITFNPKIDGNKISVTISLDKIQINENDVLTFDVVLINNGVTKTFDKFTVKFVKESHVGAIVGGSIGGAAVVAGGTTGIVKGVQSHNLKKKEKDFDLKNKNKGG